MPQGARASLVAKGSARLGAIDLSLEALAVRRESELQFYPSIVSGWMGATHPENPYDVPVHVDALLAGLPAQRYRVETVSTRSAVALGGSWGRWTYDAFIVGANEEAKAQLRNLPDPAAIAQALIAEEPSDALSLYSTSRAVAVPEHLLEDGPVERYMANASQVQASLRGPLLQLPAGALSCNVGVDYRRELMGFNLRLKDADRAVMSSFAACRVPLIDSNMSFPVIEALDLGLGIRGDNYSDIGRVTKQQFGVSWQMTDSLRWQASRAESFRPPSLAELYWRRVVAPMVIYDPKRDETAPITITTGGNPQLRATSRQSSSVSVSFQPRESWQLSAEYWRIKTRGHIAALAPGTLLAYEDFVLPGRILREPPSAEDARMGRPGKLSWLDVSRANVGGATTQGVDLSAEAVFTTSVGTFQPRLLMSLTDKFLYSDLPIRNSWWEDRAGTASEFGTIPKKRAIASLTYTRNQWRASVHARVISSYRDRDLITGEPMQRRVSGGAVWDLHVARDIGNHFRFTAGAFNVTNEEPPFAHVGGSLGFDPSQGDLAGRQIYGRLSAAFD